MAQRKPHDREAGRLTLELQCELDALRAFADLVEISVLQVEGKPWDLQSHFWRPMINALRQAQGKQLMQAGQPTAARSLEVPAFTETEKESKA